MNMDNRQLLQYIEMLRQKSDTNKLIVFVGAGVSKNVEGMPDWYELIKKGKAPRPKKIGARISVWPLTEILDYTCLPQQMRPKNSS